MSLFSPEQIDQLSADVDRQLREIQMSPQNETWRIAKGDSQGAELLQEPLQEAGLAKQAEAITTYTQEPADGFLRKFMRTGRRDLCEEEGVLYKQWKKWGDLESKEALERIGAVLMAMGISGNVLNPLAVVVTVVVIHLTVRTVCEEYGEKRRSPGENLPTQE
jgi:hypothetical protein